MGAGRAEALLLLGWVGTIEYAQPTQRMFCEEEEEEMTWDGAGDATHVRVPAA